MRGEAAHHVEDINVSRFSLRPPNFRGNAPIPKMMVAEGDEVKAGDPLFYDMQNENIKYVVPLSGEIVEIRRGPKRLIIDVIILADNSEAMRSATV